MGQLIAGTYEIFQEIGAGGAGIVYLGQHVRLKKPVVLKADKRTLRVREEVLRREVEMLKNLSNTYIPQVYDFVQEDGIVYTVMDYIEGESLDKILKRGERPPQAEVVKWACQLLDALNYLHTRPPYGILHGDIKPANIMLRPDGNICLIDFNIALALGENGAVQVGYSRGYASPEHYGVSFAENTAAAQNDAAETEADATLTAELGSGTASVTGGKSGQRSAAHAASRSHSRRGHRVMLDVRSDIYSAGATLYHLFSGMRPAIEAPAVRALGAELVSPQISKILQKAMMPDPGLRYQSAAEMLQAFQLLYKTDPRVRRCKRQRTTAFAVLTGLFLLGGGMLYVGQQRQQQRQSALKLAEYANRALAEGDVQQAVDNALAAIPSGHSVLEAPVAGEAQTALTSALGVYDLSDSFHDVGKLTLPAVPFQLLSSPAGTRFAVTYAYEAAIYDTESQVLLARLPLAKSAFSDVLFADESTVIYAGEHGVTVYDLTDGKERWTGKAATAISLSGDGRRVAAVNGEDEAFTVYDTETGSVVLEGSFPGLHQRMPANAILTYARDDIFSLNEDGTRLAVSFSNGAVYILNLQDREQDAVLLEESAYDHFEGGFAGQYLAVGARSSATSASYLSIVDMTEMAEVAAQEYDQTISVKTEGKRIYIAAGNVLERLDPGAETAEQALAYTQDAEIRSFSVGDSYTIVSASDNTVRFYDQAGTLVKSIQEDPAADFVTMAGNYGVLGSRDAEALRIVKWQSHEEAEAFAYDAAYEHAEARVSQDLQSLMLFSVDGLRVYKDGSLMAEATFPEKEQIYDQQFRRDESGSYLEVIWYDGMHRCYRMEDGQLFREEQQAAPDKELYEEFITGDYRFASELGKAPVVYKRDTDEAVMTLEENAYLTYVTEMGEYIVVQYVRMSEDGRRDKTAVLLNRQLQKIAVLPDLCDVYDDMLYFDYANGHVKQSRIYSLEELRGLAASGAR